MHTHSDIEKRVETALREAKARIPGFDYVMEYDESMTSESDSGSIGFDIMYRIPGGHEDDPMPELSNRFYNETLAVSDIFEAYDLPRLESGEWSNEKVDSDGDRFYSGFELDDTDAYDAMATEDYEPDPTPGLLDSVVANRLAGDDTPPVSAENDYGGMPSVSTNDLMSFAAGQSVNAPISSPIEDAANDHRSIESVRDAVDDYKEQRAEARNTERAERDGSKGIVFDRPSPPIAPSYVTRGGRGRLSR